MKLSKAIEILKLIVHQGNGCFDDDDLDAFKLSIEALERHQNKASLTFAGMIAPLPGETEA